MKLELKHLAPYLPYNLKMKRNGFIGELLTIKNPKENSLVDYYEFQVNCSDWWENNVDDLNPYKPILRPLSDLTKDELDEFTMCFRMYYNKSNFDYRLMTYSDAELCFKKHVDVFGLIEKGLATDKNTI